jgi:hypothetical protein
VNVKNTGQIVSELPSIDELLLSNYHSREQLLKLVINTEKLLLGVIGKKIM